MNIDGKLILDTIDRDGKCLFYGDMFPYLAYPLAELLRDDVVTVEVTWNVSFGWSELDNPQNTIVFKIRRKVESKNQVDGTNARELLEALGKLIVGDPYSKCEFEGLSDLIREERVDG